MSATRTPMRPTTMWAVVDGDGNTFEAYKHKRVARRMCALGREPRRVVMTELRPTRRPPPKGRAR